MLDSATGLIWLKNANCVGYMNWVAAGDEAAALADGDCGLTDGSVAGDWQLPTREELEGIGTDPPATWDFGSPTVTWTMPGLPFNGVQSGVQSSYDWSSTEYAGYPSLAWGVRMYDGYVTYFHRDNSSYVWPVRRDN